MYRGKSKQCGSICMYSREMDDSARKRRALARDLDHATERQELMLYYQLQMTLDDGRICGAEALMRWKHPKLGMISPAEFIPLAEETEAIIEMGEWALRAACRDAAEGKIPGTVAVNLSPVQFGREDLAEMIHAILLETGLSPSRLEVEVTELTIMSDQSRGLHILRKLKAMGISVAMDDFGTGYSSLATLHAFPFDKIKLDQSFVKRLPHDAAAAAIVRTVLALGESLRMPVLAEGIETEAQWEFLAREGCAKGQGYLFAKPAAISAVAGRDRSRGEVRPRRSGSGHRNRARDRRGVASTSKTTARYALVGLKHPPKSLQNHAHVIEPVSVAIRLEHINHPWTSPISWQSTTQPESTRLRAVNLRKSGKPDLRRGEVTNRSRQLSSPRSSRTGRRRRCP